MLARNICNGKSNREIVIEILQLFYYIVFVQGDGTKNVLCIKICNCLIKTIVFGLTYKRTQKKR